RLAAFGENSVRRAADRRRGPDQLFLARAEIEHGHDDDDGDELRQHAIAHQPVRPFPRELAADEHGNDARDKNERDGKKRDKNDNLARGHAVLCIRFQEMKAMARALTILTTVLALTLAATPGMAAAIQVTDAWTRATPGTAKNAAVYFTMTNT